MICAIYTLLGCIYVTSKVSRVQTSSNVLSDDFYASCHNIYVSFNVINGMDIKTCCLEIQELNFTCKLPSVLIRKLSLL